MSDKRRAPRIEVMGEIMGRAITLDEPVAVKQMSAGGLTIETRFPLAPGTVYDFQLTMGSQAAMIKGRIVHRRIVVEGDNLSYVSGVQFTDVTPETSMWLQDLMQSMQVLT